MILEILSGRYFIITAVLLISVLYLMAIAMSGEIGYLITAASAISLAAILCLLLVSVKSVKESISRHTDKYSLLGLAAILLFFLVLAVFFLKNTELIFFDEQIYQSTAVNILYHGSALTCYYGTGYLRHCYVGYLGFDPNGWPLLIAFAFGIFGVGTQTAYGLELVIGALSIIAVFLLSAALTDRRGTPIIAALIFALIPEFLIWVKTQANPNLPFLLFATLTTFFFVSYLKKWDRKMLAMAMFGLIFTTYIRAEALLLIPIFLIVFLTFSDSGIKRTFVRRITAIGSFNPDRTWHVLAILFLLLIMPEIFAILSTSGELQTNAAGYLGTGTQTLSSSFFLRNIVQNTAFLLGNTTVYPIVFLPSITLFAVIGTLYMLLAGKPANRMAVGLLPLLLFFGYYVFYALYFSGSVLMGTSVRFMLITYPALSILAAFGVAGAGEWFSRIMRKGAKVRGSIRAYAIYAIILLFFVVPFAYTMPFLMHPNYSYADVPIILNNTTRSSPATLMNANISLSFIDNNYWRVPSNCLVFSEEPYLWYGLNRSATQFGLDSFSAAPGNYSCYYLEYGYWCNAIPSIMPVCKAALSRFKLRLVASQNGTDNATFAIYQIFNYTGT